MKVVIFLLFVFFKYSQSQGQDVLLSCTFDISDPMCNFTNTANGNIILPVFSGEMFDINTVLPPERPLSDATSVCKLKRIF